MKSTISRILQEIENKRKELAAKQKFHEDELISEENF